MSVERGDISNLAQPRLWFVWERLLGIELRPVRRPGRRRTWWDEVISAFQVDPYVEAIIADLSFRRTIPCNIVSFVSTDDGYRDALQRLLDQHAIPAPLTVSTVERFGRGVANSPGCLGVVVPDDMFLTFGGKSVTLGDLTWI